MKILSLTSLFPNNIKPDSCVFIKERIRYLAKLHEFRVVAPVPYFPRLNLRRRWYEYAQVASHEQIAGLEVYHPRYFITPKVGMVLYGLCYFLSILSFMKKLSRVYPYELIDAHYIYPDGLAAVLLAKALKKSVILSARGTDINLFTTYPLIRRWIVYALENCDHIIAVSHALKRVMVQIGICAEKIDVIPNGVDANRFRMISKTEARKKLRIPEDTAVLLSVGTLRPLKGFQYLLAALQKLRASLMGPDLRLYIIGSGDYRSSLEDQIGQLGLQSHATLVGQIPHDEIYQWYSAADVFCLASSREGWPNVVMESLACGLPVVANRVGGIPEIITSQKYGLLIDDVGGPQGVDRLCEGILQVLSKEWNREELVAYARKHTWERVAQRVDSIFQKTLQDRNPRPAQGCGKP